MNCPTCEGYGYKNSYTCNLCKGTGLVSYQVRQRELDYQTTARIQEGYAAISRRERNEFLRANPHKDDYR